MGGGYPPFFYRLKLLCSIWAISMLQDSNFWKEASNAHSSSHQAGKECSWFKACLAFLLPDAVNIPILTSSLRFLETRRYIGISKEASDISSSWHSACFAGFMPDAGNIPLLEVCLKHFESRKNYVQMYHGPLSSAAQERQPNDPVLEDLIAFQSHALESYFHPEITEVILQAIVGNTQRLYGVGQRRDLEAMAWLPTHLGPSVVAYIATKITSNSPNRASEGAKDPPSGKR